MSVGFLIAGLESFQNNLGFNVEEFMIGRELNHGSVFPEHRIEFVEHRIEFVGARDVRKRRLGEWCAISLIEVAFIPVENCLFKQVQLSTLIRSLLSDTIFGSSIVARYSSHFPFVLIC